MKPNPKCYVCSPRPEATVELNTNTVTMATLRDKVCTYRARVLAAGFFNVAFLLDFNRMFWYDST